MVNPCLRTYDNGWQKILTFNFIVHEVFCTGELLGCFMFIHEVSQEHLPMVPLWCLQPLIFLYPLPHQLLYCDAVVIFNEHINLAPASITASASLPFQDLSVFVSVRFSTLGTSNNVTSTVLSLYTFLNVPMNFHWNNFYSRKFSDHSWLSITYNKAAILER